MFLRKSGVGAAAAALLAFSALPAAALPFNYETGFQPAASPVMEQIEDFHRLLFWIIVAVCLFVLALLVWIVMGSSRVDLQACKLEYSIVSPK